MVSSWERVFSKLLTMLTVCVPIGANTPAVPTVTVTLRAVDAPAAIGPKLPAVTPSPDSRASVMLPPFTAFCTAPRSAGPVVPVLAML